jgi:hypothetical protein
MTHVRRRCAFGALALALLLAAPSESLAALSFRIQQIFSNADGSVQFVLLREYAGQSGQDQFAGLALTTRKAERQQVFTFPANLPNANTANRAVLIATQGYLLAPSYAVEFKAVAPDFIMPDRFLPTDSGLVDFAGADSWLIASLPNDGFTALYRDGSKRDNSVTNFGGAAASLPPIPVEAIEFYNASLDHYFLSDLAPDIVALDTGRIAGWTRTGHSFKVWPISQGFLSGVCRFYIPPEHGNSHFFSASPTECATVRMLTGTDSNYSGYLLETSEAFFVAPPDAAGTCAQYWLPIYRLWNNRTDSNHRYTGDPAVKAAMIAKGYIAEGYGPNAVAMCSPLN